MSKTGTQRTTLFETAEMENREEAIETLYKFSEYQDALFDEVVNVVEGKRLELGMSKTAFYTELVGIPGSRIDKFTDVGIHKFYLSDIAWILMKCGKRLELKISDM